MNQEKIRMGETRINLITDLENHDISKLIFKERMVINEYIKRNPEFLTSLDPININDAPMIVKIMGKAARKAEVGPMAAVAGTISQLCLSYLSDNGSKHSIIDNGGDIALKTYKKVVTGLYAGNSSLSGEIGFQIKPQDTPMGICTSSGTVGHSISFGRSDAVTVFASHSSLADALATSIANYAQGKTDHDAVQNSLDRADNFREYFRGVMIVVGEQAGSIGKIPQLVKTDKKTVLGDLFEI
ncbi:UPF0280 family protein [Methanobacterium alcaliphilum]|uniref:UPF0280 family protein n=1 Tax=Methanobacterium alcaliphilum TaxID=392018 RepID=UPI00200A0CEA|nr:UPF0280 family protein [Methanobacterium alcaliphilum]MCK9152117.1 UPF0280 family protein [Methanobacterium alcaliphilum]